MSYPDPLSLPDQARYSTAPNTDGMFNIENLMSDINYDNVTVPRFNINR